MNDLQNHNLEPSFITAQNAINPEVAKLLMGLVDEEGKISSWNKNPYCKEVQIANPFSKDHSNYPKIQAKVIPSLYMLSESCMRHMNWAFGNTAFDIITGHHGFWVMRYDEGGEFAPHTDWNSTPAGIRPPIIATTITLLNDNFVGGETIFFSGDGSSTIIEREKYSILMMDGFTKHKVTPVLKGQRYALITHYVGNMK